MVAHSFDYWSLTFEVLSGIKSTHKKLARWAFILQKYDFDIIHKPNRVNQDANGLS
jgi:hypothetical protein